MFSALSQIAKHSVELAEMVVEAEIFPSVLNSLRGKHIRFYIRNHRVLPKVSYLRISVDCDEYVKKNVATLIREIAKHTPEVCHTCTYAYTS